MSSENNFAFDDRPSARSFIYIKNMSTTFCGTPALTSAQEEVCPISATLCFLFLTNWTRDLKCYHICHSVSV